MRGLRRSNLIHLDFMAVILVAAAVILLGLASQAIIIGDHLLLPVTLGSDANNLSRNALELMSFIGNSAVAVIALLALLFARRQIAEAENTRLMMVYTQISKDWDSKSITEARRSLRKHEDVYNDKIRGTPEDIGKGKYQLLIVNEDREKGGELYNESLVVMSFIEDIGLYCRKG